MRFARQRDDRRSAGCRNRARPLRASRGLSRRRFWALASTCRDCCRGAADTLRPRIPGRDTACGRDATMRFVEPREDRRSAGRRNRVRLFRSPRILSYRRFEAFVAPLIGRRLPCGGPRTASEAASRIVRPRGDRQSAGRRNRARPLRATRFLSGGGLGAIAAAGRACRSIAATLPGLRIPGRTSPNGGEAAMQFLGRRDGSRSAGLENRARPNELSRQSRPGIAA